MPTLAQFASRTKKLGQKIENEGARGIRRGVRAFVKAAAQGTPVDTGLHRSNWRVGVGRKPGGVIRPYAPYPKGSKGNGAGSGERANLTATIAAAEKQITRIRPGRGRAVNFNVFVVNNGPAIGALNSGRVMSKGARPGWIDAALTDSRARIRSTRVLRNNPEF